MPPLPDRAVALRIEQGYLPEPTNADAEADPDHAQVEGRLRRTTHPDGRIIHHHTIKRGRGLVRTEIEREITAAEFDRHWPRTAGCRIAKTRHEVRAGNLFWQIDQFDRPAGLILAEIELPTPDHEVAIPDWLRSSIVREVTDEIEYTNHALAIRLGRETLAGND